MRNAASDFTEKVSRAAQRGLVAAQRGLVEDLDAAGVGLHSGPRVAAVADVERYLRARGHSVGVSHGLTRVVVPMMTVPAALGGSSRSALEAVVAGGLP